MDMHNQNMVHVGTITETHPKYSLARVTVLGKTSGWLPVLQKANSFKRGWTALRTGEQVMVLAQRYVLRGLYNKAEKEPAGANKNTDITEYEDGTRFAYDTDKKTLTINTAGAITISAAGAVVIAAPAVYVTGIAGDVAVDGISLVNHTHPQNDGNHFGGGTNTGKPQ